MRATSFLGLPLVAFTCLVLSQVAGFPSPAPSHSGFYIYSESGTMCAWDRVPSISRFISPPLHLLPPISVPDVPMVVGIETVYYSPHKMKSTKTRTRAKNGNHWVLVDRIIVKKAGSRGTREESKKMRGHSKHLSVDVFNLRHLFI